MYSLTEYFTILNQIAPMSLSEKMILRGDYDNSGILIKCHERVEKVLFSLDLSNQAVQKAIDIKADTIVTHHPAIYMPIKNLDYTDGLTSAIILCARHNINVISMHLNLDLAEQGIDFCLAKALGAKNCTILDYIDDNHGYGREFTVKKNIEEIVEELKQNLNTQKILVYKNCQTNGKKELKVAAFCGAGSSQALKLVKENKTNASVIVTSDMPHHVIKELVEYGKSIVLITHYAGENYGFNKFFEIVNNKTSNKVVSEIFNDIRFI